MPLKDKTAIVGGDAHGAAGRWGTAIFTYFQMPDEYFASYIIRADPGAVRIGDPGTGRLHPDR
jgi:hypothetical protein